MGKINARNNKIDKNKMKTNRYWLSLFKIKPCKIRLNRNKENINVQAAIQAGVQG